MVKVIHLADDGTEMAAIEVDDFTIEVIYSGIAEMLRAAATSDVTGPATAVAELPACGASAPREDPQPDPRLTWARGPAGAASRGPGHRNCP